jgi:hypothetical protein
MEGYCSTGQSPKGAVVPMEEEEEEEEVNVNCAICSHILHPYVFSLFFNHRCQ